MMRAAEPSFIVYSTTTSSNVTEFKGSFVYLILYYTIGYMKQILYAKFPF